MKNLKLTLGMFALVAGAIVAFAFSPAPMEKAASDEPILEWFSPDLSTHVGTGTKTQQLVSCPGENIVCARGFLSMDENEQPVGKEEEAVYIN